MPKPKTNSTAIAGSSPASCSASFWWIRGTVEISGYTYQARKHRLFLNIQGWKIWGNWGEWEDFWDGDMARRRFRQNVQGHATGAKGEAND